MLPHAGLAYVTKLCLNAILQYWPDVIVAGGCPFEGLQDRFGWRGPYRDLHYSSLARTSGAARRHYDF